MFLTKAKHLIRFVPLAGFGAERASGASSLSRWTGGTSKRRVGPL